MKLKMSAQQLEWLAVIVIVLLAVFLRFSNFESKVIFYGDHSRDFLTTFKILKYYEIVWHGPAASVTWHLLSPIYYYLLIPFYLISGWHPLTQPVITGVVSLITTVLIYLCTKNLWGKKAGLVASLIYACSAIIIPDNLLGLNPGFVPIATVLLLWSTVKILKGQDKYLWLLAASLGWAISFHASAFFIIPPLIILFLIYRPRISKKNFLKALVVFTLLTIIPYGIQEKKHGGYNFITTYNYFFSKDVTSKSLQEYVPFKTSINNYLQITLKTPKEILFPVQEIPLIIVSIIIWGALVVYFTLKGRSLNEEFKISFGLLLLYAIFFGLGVRFRLAERPNWWFGNVYFPLLIINLAFLLGQVKSQVLLIVFLAVTLTTNLLYLKRYEDNQLFGRYTQEKEIADFILDDSAGGNFDFKYIYSNTEESGAVGPFIYLFWYFDKPQFQEKYFRWLNWGTNPSPENLYVIFQNTDPVDKNAWVTKLQTTANFPDVIPVKSSRYYDIYKLSKI